MITIKLIGGAKKSFSTDVLEIKEDHIPLDDLLKLLSSLKPKNTPDLDVNNILVAINGVDSSAIDGMNTIINNNDIVNIIPVIHGGSEKIELKLLKTSVYAFEIKPNKNIDTKYLDNLRNKFPKLQLQIISSKYILNSSHFKKILELSFESEKNNVLLSNKLETDILMRFALTTQILDAIQMVGMHPKENFILIAIGSKTLLKKLEKALDGQTIGIFSRDHSKFLSNKFNISKKQLNSVYSSTPLEDILVEKASVLF